MNALINLFCQSFDGRSVRKSGRASAALLVATLFLLSGCAASTAYRDGNALFASGQTSEGLAKLEEAVKLSPGNVEYRVALVSRRSSLLNNVLATANSDARNGRLVEADAGYRRVLQMDPHHTMAQQGIQSIVKDRAHQQALTEVRGLIQQGVGSALAQAEQRLRGVLAENPEQQAARDLLSEISGLRANAAKEEARLVNAYRKPITLEFSDAPIRSVFDVISQVSGLKFFFDQEVKPDLRATVFAKDTSVEDAVRLILVGNQLEQTMLNDNTVLIYPSTAQKLRDYQTLLVRGFYITNSDVKAVATSLKTIAKIRDMSVDERLGLILVRDTPEAIRLAEKIVALQDLGDPEVMLEVEVMEVKRTRLMELGIQWPSQLSLAPLPSGSVLTLRDLKNLSIDTVQASLGNVAVNARKEDQNGTTLANPRIRVRNKEKAKVLIGDRVPVISNTTTSTGFVAESVSYLDVGLKLEVEPAVYSSDEVGIKINLEVSSLVKEILSRSGALTYQIGTRGASTTLRLKNGETQILAGLISDEDRTSAAKVPALGELPILGRLFGSQKDDTQRSEILLSITPRVLRSLPRPDMSIIEFDSGTESRVGAPSLTLSPSLAKQRLEELPQSLPAKNVSPSPLPFPSNPDLPAQQPQQQPPLGAPERISGPRS